MFDNVIHPSSNDLENFTNKVLTDHEKRQFIDLGTLQPPGPFPKEGHQKSRCFLKSFYSFYTSKYGSVHRSGCVILNYWMLRTLNPADCLLLKGVMDWRHLSEKIKKHGHTETCAVYEIWKKIYTVDKDFENEILKEASFRKMVLKRLFDVILTLAKNSLALRGHRENLSEEGYHGNFLSVIITCCGKFWICLKDLQDI